MASTPKIIVVGGGLAGLAAVIKIAEMGGTVDLFSIVPVKRSHSVCAQGGINGAKNLKGEGDSTWQHFDDTVYGGDFLPTSRRSKAMCDDGARRSSICSIAWAFLQSHAAKACSISAASAAPCINRTAFAGATTGQQLLYALDEQVRRYEAEGKVNKFERWEFLSAVLDGSAVCRGICAMDLRTHGGARLSGRRRHHRDRRPRRHLRQVDQLDGLHRQRSRLCTSRARTTPTANSSRCIRPRFPAKTSCG